MSNSFGSRVRTMGSGLVMAVIIGSGLAVSGIEQSTYEERLEPFAGSGWVIYEQIAVPTPEPKVYSIYEDLY